MSSKPHGRDCPERCSQCRGAKPRLVTFDAGGHVLIDGKPFVKDPDPKLEDNQELN